MTDSAVRRDGDVPVDATASAQRRTPTPGGYLLAGTLAVVMFAGAVGVVIAVATLSGGGDAARPVAAITAGLTYGAFAGICAAVTAAVLGIPLSMLAHVALTSARRQSIHVLTFGIVGILSATGVLVLFGALGQQPGAWIILTGTGVCTALGRLIVGRRQGLRTG